MKNKFSIILSIFFGLILMGCKKDFLDKRPFDQYGDQDVWKDLQLMQTFVNNIYFNIPHGFTELMLASVSDESILTYDGGSSNVTNSLITPSDYSIFEVGNFIGVRTYKMSWDWVYKYVRACNLFLQQVEKNTYDDQDLKNRLIGEVHFLRAYYYHNLVFLYGGVPIITEAYELDGDHLAARDSFEECISFIADECDKAADLLPEIQGGNNKGRATKGAALALKSRVLLFAASDLYHNPSWAQGYTHPELISYVGANRTAQWKAAKDAAKAVMDLNQYALYKPDPAPGDNIAKNYQEIFLSKSSSEDIFYRSFIQASKISGYNPGLFNNPNGYFGFGGNTPVGQLVDAFEMKDGTPFSWDNPVQAVDPYLNREPRFYANILYNGAKWRKRDPSGISQDPVGEIQTSFKQLSDGSYLGGLDTRSTTAYAKEDGSYTGYYLRKFIDPDLNPQFFVQEWPWRFIRYAEVILNYAEACVELGQEEEARQYVNSIRKRAGLPDISASGPALMQAVKHERQIELMYEDQRFFDIRRWMIAPDVLSSDAMGIDIRYPLNATQPIYKQIPVRVRDWKDQSYFMPIKLDEMNRNNLLVQNPLY